MSDKQRQDHLAAYWNGPLTRAEAQKVFDEMAGVIQKANETIVKLDMVLAFLVEKSGAETTEIQTWMDNRVKTMRAQMEKTNADSNTESETGQRNEPSALVTP